MLLLDWAAKGSNAPIWLVTDHFSLAIPALSRYLLLNFQNCYIRTV